MTQKKSSDKLTQKMEDFCFHFVYTHIEDALEATKAAGYEYSNPHEMTRKSKALMENPACQAKIAELRETKGKSKLVDKHYVIKKLKAIVDDKNEATREKLKALELIGKYLKMFTDRHIEKEVTITKDLAIAAQEARMAKEREEEALKNQTVDQEANKFIEMRQKNG